MLVYYNLKKNPGPSFHFKGDEIAVVAHEATGEERENLFTGIDFTPAYPCTATGRIEQFQSWCSLRGTECALAMDPRNCECSAIPKLRRTVNRTRAEEVQDRREKKKNL